MTHLRKQALSGPGLTRELAPSIRVIDDSARTFEVSFASDDVAVLRRNYFDDPWLEVLGCKPDECDLTRIANNAAPVLWNHDRWDRKSHIGIVEKAWIDGGRCHAKIRLSDRAELDDIWRDVKNGILTNISTGYTITERVLTKQNEDGPSEYRVTRWQPYEISLVSVPADDTVGIGRSADTPANFTVTDLHEERTMDKQNDTPAGSTAVEDGRAGGDSAPVVETRAGGDTPTQRKDDGATAQAAVAAERSRIAAIGDLCRDFELGDEFERKHIKDGSTVDQVRAAALDSLRSKQGTEGPRIVLTADQAEKTRAMAETQLLSRMGYVEKDGKAPNMEGNEFRGFSMLDLARSMLERAGVRTRGLDKLQLATLALGLERGIGHSTSDFSIALGNVFNKVLLRAYGIIPDTWSQFCAVGSVSDFRASDRYRAGTFGNLAEIPEGGEYTYGNISDAEKNSIRAKTKGKMFAVTRQLLINDDLGVLNNILALMGRGAKRTVESDVYAFLIANANMDDGGALFNSTAVTTPGGHANLAGSGAAPDVSTIAAMSQAMQTQSFGGDYIDVPPSIFLGPIALAEQVKVLNASQYDPESNKFQKPNQVRGLFSTIIGTPRLTGNAWYMFADPNVEPVIEVAFLDGRQEPYTEQRAGWNVDGIEYKVRLDYGIAAVGFRGARKNPGT